MQIGALASGGAERLERLPGIIGGTHAEAIFLAGLKLAGGNLKGGITFNILADLAVIKGLGIYLGFISTRANANLYLADIFGPGDIQV
jgi:hypothetical protein